MGPRATAHFYDLLTRSQHVNSEQEYVDVLLYSLPSLPDRTAYITGRSTESPLPGLVAAAKKLQAAGVTCIAMPCITAHFFYEPIAAAVEIPVVHMLKETAKTLAAHPGLTRVGLLATDGTLAAGGFSRALAAHNIATLQPSPQAQARLMQLIYDIKRGQPIDVSTLEAQAQELQAAGATHIILGCTELSLAAPPGAPGWLDPLQSLAHAVLALCKG